MASIALLDQNTLQYSDELLKLAGIQSYRNLLPEIVPAWEVAGKVTKAAAEATGLKRARLFPEAVLTVPVPRWEQVLMQLVRHAAISLLPECMWCYPGNPPWTQIVFTV